MSRFNGTEKAGLVLAVVIIIVGFCMIVHPIAMYVFHPTGAPYVGSGDGAPQHVSKETARFVGGGAILLGAGIAGIVLYRPRSK